ncbi:MAG: DUF262 domain-containing protein [Planctomycetes bacterium]|nr:DUF262 domain-containing protein [Planctomycetota bacterium]
MKAIERTLQQMLVSAEQYVIPVFQRYYTWERKNWAQLWDDIIELKEDAKPRHFMGAIVCVPERPQPGNIVAFQVIDGQQRLVTLSLLLSAMRDLALKEKWDDLAGEIEESYLIHKYRNARERYKLFPRLRDRGSYLQIIDKKISDHQGQIAAAYVYHKKRLDKEGFTATRDDLRSFFQLVALRLDFVAITLDEENPYKIFRSLNSTGVDLEEGDLIRNQVFMSLNIDDQDAFDDDYWRPLEQHFYEDGKLNGKQFAQFFRDVLMKDGAYVPAKGIFDAFEVKFPIPLDSRQLVGELSTLALDHNYMRGATRHPDAKIAEALSHVLDLGATTAFPLLLALFDLQREQKLMPDQLRVACRAISSFVFRRYVCNHTSKPYSRWFCTAAKVVRDSSLEGLLEFLLSKGWPTNEEFKQGFLTLSIYESPYARAVLSAIERSIQRPAETVDLSGCTIEHIMPQTIHPGDEDGDAWIEALGDNWQIEHLKWLHTPGNLTLVGSDYNIEMRNGAFSDKRRLLTNSKVYLNQYFSGQEVADWNVGQIKKRCEYLSRVAVKIWPGPDHGSDDVV